MKIPIQNLIRCLRRKLGVTMPISPSMVMASGNSKVTPKMAMMRSTKFT